MDADFRLDARLAADTLPLCRSAISLVRVSRDARFPWLILVPMRDGLADLVDLEIGDEAEVLADVRAASLALKAATSCHKLNIASLGNQVRQLHVHIIARFEGDAAWPGPVWGTGEAEMLDALPAWAKAVASTLQASGWETL